ncbi:MAG: DUF4252 domain-containing protein [bacterium]
MKTMKIFIAFIILFTVCVSASAQEKDLKKHPGYIDLKQIRIPDHTSEVTDIDLGPALLALARLGVNEDEDFGKGLAGILSIRVKSYEIEYGDAREIRPTMDKLEKKLEQDGWMRLVRTKTREEMTNISMKVVDGKVVGFFLMSINGDEVSFINVFGGNIDLNSIKNIGMGLSGSALDSLGKSLKHRF